MSDDSPAAGHATESEKHATAPGRTEPEKMVAAFSRTSEEPARDRTGFKLAAFVATLIVVLFAGYGLGRVNNGAASAAAPQQNPGAAPQALGATAMPGMVMDGTQPHTHAGGGTSGQRATVGGFSLSSAGLTLVSQGTTFTAGQPQRLAFRITAVGGAPVTAFAVVHGMPLHLVVIRRDLSAFQHLHPIMAPDGTWSIDLTLPAPDIYRMIADFTAVVGGRQVTTTLGTDLTVAGNYLPAALPAPARASVDDDLTVRYEGTPDLRSIQTILLSVTGADGRPRWSLTWAPSAIWWCSAKGISPTSTSIRRRYWSMARSSSGSRCRVPAPTACSSTSRWRAASAQQPGPCDSTRSARLPAPGSPAADA